MMNKDSNKNRMIVDYDRLGTISESELIEALIDDIKLIREKYGIKFYTGAKLHIWATNEHGEPRSFKRSGNSARIKWINTSHYRPACLDYDL